jgi:hypothetical protein
LFWAFFIYHDGENIKRVSPAKMFAPAYLPSVEKVRVHCRGTCVSQKKLCHQKSRSVASHKVDMQNIRNGYKLFIIDKK